MIKIYGDLVDKVSRCIHYHSELDIIALKCFGCQRYYACFACHNDLETHTFVPYPRSLLGDNVVICGSCKTEMTISTYEFVTACPNCKLPFNPNCKLHADIYFE